MFKSLIKNDDVTSEFLYSQNFIFISIISQNFNIACLLFLKNIDVSMTWTFFVNDLEVIS